MTERVKGDDSFVVEPQLFEQESQNYDIVTFAVRIKLIKLVCGQNYKINKAAKVLNVNQSTAKYIIRSFRNKGKILMKSIEDQQINQQQLKQLEELKAKFQPLSQQPQKRKKKKKKHIKNQKKYLAQKQQKKAKLESNNQNYTAEDNIKIQQKIQEQNFIKQYYPQNMINDQFLLYQMYMASLSYWNMNAYSIYQTGEQKMILKNTTETNKITKI